MNRKRGIYSPRVVVADPQGDVIHIKNKATGRIILRLKLRPDQRSYGDYELLLDMCGGGNQSGAVCYQHDLSAGREVDKYEGSAA